MKLIFDNCLVSSSELWVSLHRSSSLTAYKSPERTSKRFSASQRIRRGRRKTRIRKDTLALNFLPQQKLKPVLFLSLLLRLKE